MRNSVIIKIANKGEIRGIKMDLACNQGKEIRITVKDIEYDRYAVKTHYVKKDENYIDIIKKYVSDIYSEGDIISISEKIISLCQGRVLYKKDIRLSFTAKFLSKFVNITPAGEAVGNPYKMQIAIMLCGKWKVIYAAILAGIGKLFHRRGIFYEIVGQQVSGIDGFCDDAFEDYLDMGILNPEDPTKVCNEIYEQLGIKAMVVDANDIDVEILGKADAIDKTTEELKAIIKDNPAGQANQQTPIILIRKVAGQLEEMTRRESV